MIELVMVIVIVGILASVAAPRFFDGNVFQSRGFSDQVQASLRYAQKVAIAKHRNVCVAFTANSVTLTMDSDTPADLVCNPAPAGNLPSPTGDPAYVIAAPAGVAFAAPPANFNFNALGRPSVGQAITVNGAPNSITVEADTGYVHQ